MKTKTNLNAFARGEAAVRIKDEKNPFEPGSHEHRNFEMGRAHATAAAKAPSKFSDRKA